MLYSFLFLFPGVHIILIYLKIVNFWKFSLPCLCKKWFPQNYFFYLFLDRGREGEREGEKHQCIVASHVPPTGDLAHNPGMCPDWESNQQPFGSQGATHSTGPHQPGPKLRLSIGDSSYAQKICINQILFQRKSIQA